MHLIEKDEPTGTGRLHLKVHKSQMSHFSPRAQDILISENDQSRAEDFGVENRLVR